MSGSSAKGYGSTGELPSVSIGIPTYNSDGQVEHAVLSILAQDYPNLEVIISDNCSTDSTEQICRRFARDFPQIRYYRQTQNTGLMPNFDFVLKQASGEYFMWIADDDKLEPGILKKYIAFLQSHPEYSLVSGQILYWYEGRSMYREGDLDFDQKSPSMRVLGYYFKVVHGAMIYGLMRRVSAEMIPLRNRIGEDWHFVASLACLGRIRNFNCIGYHKKFGGASKNFRQYAQLIGASRFSGEFPRIRIAMDSISEILFQSPVYASMPAYGRLMLAVAACAAILIKYGFKELPFIVGGKLKRAILSLAGLKQKVPKKDQRSRPLDQTESARLKRAGISS
jgi:glycosyltransferase involved in cell wall biosynthesis